MSDLTCCLIVRNEERNLQKCLDSVHEMAPEIVIADTGSTDATIQIALSNNAKVSSFDFTKIDFAAARNHTLARATNRWILVLDADETLDRASIPIVQSLIAGSENAGYYVARRNHASDTAGFTTDYLVRLFPNRPDCRYRGRVHETVDAAILASGGKLLTTAIHLDHNFVASREARRLKNHRYIEILHEEIAADPADTTRLDFLAAEYHQLEMFHEAATVAELIVQLRPLDASAHLNAGIYHLVFQANPLPVAYSVVNQ